MMVVHSSVQPEQVNSFVGLAAYALSIEFLVFLCCAAIFHKEDAVIILGAAST